MNKTKKGRKECRICLAPFTEKLETKNGIKSSSKENSETYSTYLIAKQERDFTSSFIDASGTVKKLGVIGKLKLFYHHPLNCQQLFESKNILLVLVLLFTLTIITFVEFYYQGMKSVLLINGINETPPLQIAVGSTIFLIGGYIIGSLILAYVLSKTLPEESPFKLNTTRIALQINIFRGFLYIPISIVKIILFQFESRYLLINIRTDTDILTFLWSNSIITLEDWSLYYKIILTTLLVFCITLSSIYLYKVSRGTLNIHKRMSIVLALTTFTWGIFFKVSVYF